MYNVRNDLPHIDASINISNVLRPTTIGVSNQTVVVTYYDVTDGVSMLSALVIRGIWS